MGHLDKYYDKAISAIHDATSILIFGPGEAKGELKKRIENKKLKGHKIAVEAADEMTEPQIAAKVRQRFLNRNYPIAQRAFLQSIPDTFNSSPYCQQKRQCPLFPSH